MKPERVIVVDDDQTLVTVMGAAVTRQGFAVETFLNGASALEALKSGEPTAVLVTDLDMPGMHGLELLRAARQHDPRLEVIVVTGFGTLEKAVQAMRADGAFDFISKPFETLRVLTLAVERAAARRRLLLERAALTERLNILLTHSADAILMAEADGTLVVANPAAERLLKSEALLGKPASAVLPKPLQSLLANWQAMGQGLPMTVEIAGPDQMEWMVSLAPAPQMAEAGAGWMMTIRDTTQFRRLDELKFQVLSEAANKLRVPLAKAIMNMTELNLLVGAQNPRAADLLYQQTTVWERIKHWMDDILTLVRVEAGLGLRLVDVDLAVALPEIVAALPEALTRQRHLDVHVKLAHGTLWVRFDRELLRQLVQALVEFSAQRRGEAGGRVLFTVRLQNDQVWLEVADDGPAIRSTDLLRLFEKSRLDSSNTEQFGLELAVVKSVVDRMGGQVWIRQNPAGGSMLAISLPLVVQREAAV